MADDIKELESNNNQVDYHPFRSNVKYVNTNFKINPGSEIDNESSNIGDPAKTQNSIENNSQLNNIQATPETTAIESARPKFKKPTPDSKILSLKSYHERPRGKFVQTILLLLLLLLSIGVAIFAYFYKQQYDTSLKNLTKEVNKQIEQLEQLQSNYNGITEVITHGINITDKDIIKITEIVRTSIFETEDIENTNEKINEILMSNSMLSSKTHVQQAPLEETRDFSAETLNKLQNINKSLLSEISTTDKNSVLTELPTASTVDELISKWENYALRLHLK